MDVRIKTAQDVDIRENIFYRMAELQCPILKMQYSSLSLEDVFLELTEDSEAEENSEAAEDTSEENDTEEFFEEEFPEDTPEEENIEEKEKENESNL